MHALDKRNASRVAVQRRTRRQPSDFIAMDPDTPRMKALQAGRLFSERNNIGQRVLGAKCTSWWASAAVGVTASSNAVLTAELEHVRNVARARNHAQTEIRSVDAWRNDACDTFLTPRKPPRVPKLTTISCPDPVEPQCRSPDHFQRKYGLKRSNFSSPRTITKLEPLKFQSLPRTSCGTVGMEAQLTGRAAENAEARAACWKRSRVTEDASDSDQYRVPFRLSLSPRESPPLSPIDLRGLPPMPPAPRPLARKAVVAAPPDQPSRGVMIQT